MLGDLGTGRKKKELEREGGYTIPAVSAENFGFNPPPASLNVRLADAKRLG